jgi:hypothetical protein
MNISLDPEPQVFARDVPERDGCGARHFHGRKSAHRCGCQLDLPTRVWQSTRVFSASAAVYGHAHWFGISVKTAGGLALLQLPRSSNEGGSAPHAAVHAS